MAKNKKRKQASGKPASPGQAPEAAAASPVKDISRLDSPSFRVFSGLVALLFLAALLAGNEATTIWNGSEAATLWQALSPQPESWLTRFLHAVYDDGPLSVFYLRFFGIFFLLLSLFVSAFIGRRLFGKTTIWLALLLLSASLLLPNLAKRASTDIYLFSTQLLFGMSTLIFLKSPGPVWRVLLLAGLWLSFALEPIGALLFALPFLLLLRRSHPQATLLQDWRLWVPAVAGLALLAVLRPSPWLDDGISFAWLRAGYLRYLGWQLIGVLPFIGFVAGGIRDLFYKIRRGEELSLLLAAWILAALLSQSTTLSWALALLAAKQVQSYFDPRYPFFAWVRGPAILQLVLAFLMLAGGMIYGFWEFQMQGFRSLLMVSGLYWCMSFLGVIGLYGYNHRLLIGGPVLAGVLLNALFWFQAAPLLENKRHWVQEIVERAEAVQSKDRPEVLLLYHPGHQQPFPALAVYGLDKLGAVNLATSEESLKKAAEAPGSLLILEQATAEQWNMASTVDTLSGWNDQLEEIHYLLAAPR